MYRNLVVSFIQLVPLLVYPLVTVQVKTAQEEIVKY